MTKEEAAVYAKKAAEFMAWGVLEMTRRGKPEVLAVVVKFPGESPKSYVTGTLAGAFARMLQGMGSVPLSSEASGRDAAAALLEVAAGLLKGKK